MLYIIITIVVEQDYIFAQEDLFFFRGNIMKKLNSSKLRLRNIN